jgi:hypothetical protein
MTDLESPMTTIHLSVKRRLGELVIVFAVLLALVATGMPVALANHDTVYVTPTAGLVTTEAGGTATFTVVLGVDQGPADVTIGLSSNNTAEGTVSPATLTFTSSDWSIPQTVTVTGVNDSVLDGDAAYTVVLAPIVGGSRAGVDPPDVAVSNSDDEGITVAPSATPLITNEAGATATFTAVLKNAPTGDVTVGVSSSDVTEGTVSTATLTFTDVNWATPQTVTVTGVNDFVDDGNIAYTVVLAPAVGGGYDGYNPTDVTASNTDNDTAGITVIPTATPLVTSEAGIAATFTVVLNTEPTASVSIGVSSSDVTEGTVSTATLTFTTINWATPQTVTVTGVNDSAGDGNVAYTVILAAAAGGGYAGIDPTDVAARNNDTIPDVAVPVMGLVDTSAACPDSIAVSGFGDLAGLDETTVQAIDCIFQYGISNGTTDSTFAPTGNVTRWQMALFLMRQVQTHGVALPAATDQGFTDIGSHDQATRDAINQLAQLGITQGTGNGNFSPDDAISRWEMALFLVRFVGAIGITTSDGAPSAAFMDLSAFNSETRDAIDQLVELGIAAGTSSTTFEPSNDVLRWQMALFLTRVLAVDGSRP